MKSSYLLFLTYIVAILTSAVSAVAFEGDTYTSQADAGVVYSLQGEYLGVVESWGGTWGAQVLATSEKTLTIHLLNGGLPGDGFNGREPSKVFKAEIDKDHEQAQVTNDSAVILVKSDELTVSDADGKKLGVLTKLVRESPTQGAKPDANGAYLFDQKINNFVGAKTIEDGLLGVGGTTKELFEDHHLHIEFRTPFQPSDSGQGRGNSGVYVQGRYELQVLDSFGLRGEDNECGGIYQIARPKLNMCYPPLTWQTYDIDFTAAKYNPAGQKTSNAKITIKHNGVVIHDNLELPKATPGKDPEANKPGPLFLQDHSNPVAFRNIWFSLKQGKKVGGPRVGVEDPL